MKLFLVFAAVLVAALLLAHFLRANQFATKIGELDRRLVSSQGETAPDQSLVPVLVREFATRDGGRVGGPPTVQMLQDAQMRLSKDQPFFALEASQISGTRQPGFVWQAKGTMLAIVPLQIVDAYVEAAGELEVRIAGSVTVAQAIGPETAKGEAMRFLAELPWNPDAILNATGLMWRQVDEASVEVSMQTGGGAARVTLHFNKDGDIIAIEGDDRPRAGDTPARWVGRFSNYVQVGTYRFPRYGEIAWDLPEGEFVYWRGNILSVTPSAP